MSGFVRTLQKRIFRKNFGMSRQTSEVRTNKLDGRPYIHRFKRGEGPIVNTLGDKLGQNYPRFLPATATE